MWRQLQFLGHIIDQSGSQPDTDKVGAIWQLSPPADVQELILGMMNYLGRYGPNSSTVGQSLYEHLKNAWTLGHAQQAAFEHIKELLKTTPIFTFY